jgi:hypothetical protein
VAGNGVQGKRGVRSFRPVEVAARKKGGPHLSEESYGPPNALIIPESGLHCPVLLPSASVYWCVDGVALAAPASIPKRLATVRFISASAAGPAESRIDLLRGTPRRCCGEGETRDWSRRFRSK